MRTLMLVMLVVGCGGSGKPFVQQTAIGAACDPTGTSEHPPDCATPLVCTDAFKTGDMCVRLFWSGCDGGQDSYTSSSGLLICLPKCGTGCNSGWTCTDGVCVPPH